MTKYAFDTSCFINGRRDLLPPEVFPTVWGDIERLVQEGSVRSVDVVKVEIGRRDDTIKAWAEEVPALFVELDERIQTATSQVLAVHPKLTGVGGGRNAADAFVIGHAISVGGKVVTEETMSGNLAKPRIPDVCNAMSVPWMPLVGFLREQGWRY